MTTRDADKSGGGKSGGVTAEEVAAIVAVLLTRGDPAPATAAAPRSRWSVPQLRAPLAPGPGAWQASADAR